MKYLVIPSEKNQSIAVTDVRQLLSSVPLHELNDITVSLLRLSFVLHYRHLVVEWWSFIEWIRER